MTTTYVKYFINPNTKEIEHIATSDSPIPDEVMVEAVSDSLQPVPAYRVEFEEFETEGHVRAREMLQARKVNPGTGKVMENTNCPEHIRRKILAKRGR